MTFKKVCKICGHDFESDSRNTRYCSEACSKRACKKAARRRKLKENLSAEHYINKDLDSLIQKGYKLSREIAEALLPYKCDCHKSGHVCEGELQVHHIDHNPLNTSPSNLRWLCVKAHAEVHADEEDCDVLNELKAYKTIKDQYDIRVKNESLRCS